jgi:hypothetical protein
LTKPVDKKLSIMFTCLGFGRVSRATLAAISDGPNPITGVDVATVVIKADPQRAGADLDRQVIPNRRHR